MQLCILLFLSERGNAKERRNKRNRTLTSRPGFGHESNPSKIEPTVHKGDVMLVPAGVGHKLVDDFDTGFEMVGSYPVGTTWDMCFGRADEAGRVKEIENVAWFEKDPLYGEKIL